MVSHIDDDHIQGILELTRSWSSRSLKEARLVKVLGFWHNRFDDIIGKKPDELTAAFRSQFGAAAVSGKLSAEARSKSERRGNRDDQGRSSPTT